MTFHNFWDDLPLHSGGIFNIISLQKLDQLRADVKVFKGGRCFFLSLFFFVTFSHTRCHRAGVVYSEVVTKGFVVFPSFGTKIRLFKLPQNVSCGLVQSRIPALDQQFPGSDGGDLIFASCMLDVLDALLQIPRNTDNHGVLRGRGCGGT